MGDEVKPKLFAEAVFDQMVAGDWRLAVDGRPLPTLTKTDCQVAAASINAAVAAREARLVAALRNLKEQVQAIASMHLGDSEALWRPLMARDLLLESIGHAQRTLEGKGDYVPRAALEAEREKNRGLWEKLNDALHEGGLASERAAALMAALGIEPKPKPIAPASWLSKQTHAAVSQHNAALERVIAQTTAQMDRMRIEEHANSLGELRSVLVVDNRPHTSVWSRLVGDSFMTQTTRHEVGGASYPWLR